MLFCVDILAFAGLAFIFLGILKKFEISNKWLIVIAIVMSLIGTFTRGIDFGMPVLNLFFAKFIGCAGGFGAFPLFNWFIFPVAGYVRGQYFIRAKDKGIFFKFWPLCIIVAFVYFILSSQVLGGGILSNDVHLYYFMTTLDAMFCILFVHGIIGLCYNLTKWLPDKIIKLFSILSNNINTIYIMQWLFIPVGIILLVYLVKGIVLTDLIAAVFSIFIVALSTVFAVYYKKLRAA